MHSDWTPESDLLLSHCTSLLLLKKHFAGAFEPTVSDIALTDCAVLVEFLRFFILNTIYTAQYTTRFQLLSDMEHIQ